MDKQILKNKLKKYLFFVSIVFFSITAIHLVYSFIYFDSKEVPQKGGTISESFVGKFPNLNPLLFSKDNNSYINHILYRSLSSYDIYNQKIVGDLANCDIENPQKIKCELSENAKWSNGDNITSEDIISTYEIIKKYNTNPILKSILDKVEIKDNKTNIEFISNLKDINILNILFQPIVSKKITDKLTPEELKKPFSPIDGIYSGKYIITKIDQDETIGYKRIFLEKNSFYMKNPVYIENYILKFYKDYPSLLKQKENISIFNDKKNLIGNSIPKLKNHKYILPQYIGIFINKDKIEYPNIRKYILSTINNDEILKIIGEENNKKIDSPFLNNIKLNIEKPSISLKTMLNSLGYYKKQEFLDYLEKKDNKIISGEVKIQNNLEKDKKDINLTKIKNSITKENYNSKSKIIISPSWVDKYNFITKPNIILEGKVGENIENIYINDYKLKNYKLGNKTFFYKLSPSLKNIKNGENIYKIYFEKNNKKELIEEIYFYYDKNKQNLEKLEQDLITKLINQKIKQEKEKIIEINKQKTKNTSLEKQEKIKNNNKIEERKKQIEKLDNNFYYNKDLKVFSLNLTYINGSKEIELTAQNIKKQLEKSGIKINLSPIKSSILQKQIKENKENYDIILSGINLGYFNFNLSKYFYSGQINSGKNLSKIKSSKLDNLLEDLNSINITNKKEIIKLENSLINILKQENIFKPIYSPYYSNLVLKNIEGYELPNILPKDYYRFKALIKAYILKEKIINNDNKNLFSFIKYLINNLF